MNGPNLENSPKSGSSRKQQESDRAREIVRFRGHRDSTESDEIAVEEPLEIRLNDEPVSVTMRTPGHDRELAVGFLFTEGIVEKKADLTTLDHEIEPTHPGRCNVIHVRTHRPVDLKKRGWQRNFVSASSCGLCGKASIAAIKQHAPPIDDSLCVDPEKLYAMPEHLRSRQHSFAATGGIHAAGLFDKDGNCIRVREDIGRHNAVDKLVGAALLENALPLSGQIMMVSGRTSFEIVQKALVARIPLLAGVSAGSSLAIELAHESNMTLVGFLRGESMNIYAGAKRVRVMHS